MRNAAMPVVTAMLAAFSSSAASLRGRITNPRYGEPGTILFDFDGVTYTTKEPSDVMPLEAGNPEATKSWCVRQILDGVATRHEGTRLRSKPNKRTTRRRDV